jgi:hypothetical protein
LVRAVAPLNRQIPIGQELLVTLVKLVEPGKGERFGRAQLDSAEGLAGPAQAGEMPVNQVKALLVRQRLWQAGMDYLITGHGHRPRREGGYAGEKAVVACRIGDEFHEIWYSLLMEIRD